MIGCLNLLFAGFSDIKRTIIYSPTRRYALVVINSDLGATGGGSAVWLYSSHGFHKDALFVGKWNQTDPDHVRWLNDTEVVVDEAVRYGEPSFCKGARHVTVHCGSPTRD